MKSHSLSSIVRTDYGRCDEIRRTPAKIFDWSDRKIEASSVTKRTCIFAFHNATGDKIPVYTSLMSTVREVKDDIAKVVIIPVNHIRLSWHGQVLVDSRTLVSYGIMHGHCVHLSCSIGGTEEVQGDDAPSPRRLFPSLSA
jgi:hypothetical protein